MPASLILPQPTSVNKRFFEHCTTSSDCINDEFFRCNRNRDKCEVRPKYRKLLVPLKSSNIQNHLYSYSNFIAYTSQAIGVPVLVLAIGATPMLKLLSWQQIMAKNVSVPGHCTLTTPLLVTLTEGLTPERCVTTES